MTNKFIFWYVIIVLILIREKQRKGGKLMEQLLKPRDVAKLFQVTSACLLSWVESGIFPAIKINKTVRFRKRDVEWFLENQYTGDTALMQR